MDWEDEIKILLSDWVKRMIKFGEVNKPNRLAGFTVYDCPYIYPIITNLLKSQRQDLLKELRGEVEGMKLPTSTRNYITKAEPINKKLQDVIKLLERGNEYD